MSIPTDPVPPTTILFLVPALETVHTEFMLGFVNLVTQMTNRNGISVQIVFNQQKPWATARNALANEAIKYNCKYCLWLDTDVMFSPTDFEMALKFMEASPPDVGAVTGIYFLRHHPHVPIVYKLNSSRTKPFHDVFYNTHEEPYEIDRAGLGFCLMRTTAIKKVHEKLKGEPFFHTAYESEDMYFFRHMQSVNYKLFAHPKIILKHDIFTEDYYIKTTRDKFVLPSLELSEYLGKTPEEVYWSAMSAPDKVRMDIIDIINSARYDQSRVVDSYYYSSPNILYEDIYQTTMTGWASFAKDISKINPPPKRILNLCGGIGDSAMQLLKIFPDAQVDVFERNSPSLDYLEWRLKKRKETRIHPIRDDSWRKNLYDMIFGVMPISTPEEARMMLTDVIPLMSETGHIALIAYSPMENLTKPISAFIDMKQCGLASDGHPEIWRKAPQIKLSGGQRVETVFKPAPNDLSEKETTPSGD